MANEKNTEVTDDQSLIQLRVDKWVKDATDVIFERNGLTTQAFLKVVLTTIATSGQSPFDTMFLPSNFSHANVQQTVTPVTSDAQLKVLQEENARLKQALLG